MFADRVFRLTPPRTIYAYLPEILNTIGVVIEKKEGQKVNGQFKAVVEGRTTGEDAIHLRVQLRGAKEPWLHRGGNFLPSVYTTHVVSEAHQREGKAWKDTESSMELLRQFNAKISLYVWHTAG